MENNNQRFQENDRFQHKINNKTGTVKRLRDDLWEQKNSWPANYHYSVNFDDGTFETYLNERYMKPI